MTRTRERCIRAAAAMLLIAANAFACGPNFPNNLLSRGDTAMLEAPLGNFEAELSRMKLGKSTFASVPPKAGYDEQTSDAEEVDLERALRNQRTSKADSLRIRSAHQLNRALLQKFLKEQKAWEVPQPAWERIGEQPTQRQPPIFPRLFPPEGLPGEFADYFEGALAWHNPGMIDKAPARATWERLLARTETERRYKSTWAAFMLGKYWETNRPAKAIECFSMVRKLAAGRFADSAGLAAASLGLEARVHLRLKHYPEAIELYLDQLASGDETANNSLKFVAAEVFAHANPDVLKTLAENERSQRMLTAYVISRSFRDNLESAVSNEQESTPGSLWLEAVEAAGVRDVDSAEKLALAAYQENRMEMANRWLKRAPASPLSQWLQAKLLLRAGKLSAAAKLMGKVVESFPVENPSTNRIPTTLADNLLTEDTDDSGHVLPYRRVRAELGVLQLARSEYTGALDALLQAGYWMDAAYVAERVLTIDELKSYVARSWPAITNEEGDELDREKARNAISSEHPARIESSADQLQEPDEPDSSPRIIREKIRYLLARRLTRNLRGDEARAYYPNKWQPQFDALAADLRTGWDQSLPSDQRAQALFQAAWLTRTNGMELIGSELQPDWAIYGGNYDWGVQWEERATNSEAVVVRASTNEIQRAANHHADPEARFHYRYQAASLAWEAAKLMPDNSDETAKVLWAAGTWLKNRDPETADLFYKALVNRNRRTELGAAADRQRWFPKVGPDGKPLPKAQPEPTPPNELEMEPGPPGSEENGAPEEAAPSNPPRQQPAPSGDRADNHGISYSARASLTSALQFLTLKGTC